MASSCDATELDTDQVLDYHCSSMHVDSQQCFTDLDNPANLESLLGKAGNNATRNFLVDFGLDSAQVAFDVDQYSVDTPVCTQHHGGNNTRWFNIWLPTQQRSLLEFIAKKYDFSPRLLALMCSSPEYHQVPYSANSRTTSTRRGLWKRGAALQDPERGSNNLSELQELPELCSVTSNDTVATANLYKIIDEIWHYSSVDFGRKYVCVGYNSLYGTKHTQQHHEGGRLPHCKRVWTWLVLCDDSTIITINEYPFPHTHGELGAVQQRILAETRRNFLDVFRSLSAVNESPLTARNPLTLLPLRRRTGSTPEELAHYESDAPGLLFYYLFENWQNSYTLVTRRESRYGRELENLRNEMLQSPQLSHIDRLHRMGEQLGLLRRHYESYQRIIDRVLEPCDVPTAASLQNSHIIDGRLAGSDADNDSLNTIRPDSGSSSGNGIAASLPMVTEQSSTLGVSLSSAARVRFKRLKDLIDLYALSEVEEYLKQKDALVAMNFNLIAIKESRDVEKLTRVALLLTKFTILFLPVSLMTAYFGCNLATSEYTIAEYWTAFAAILACSWCALLLFGLYSDSLQTGTMLKASWKGAKDMWRKLKEA